MALEVAFLVGQLVGEAFQAEQLDPLMIVVTTQEGDWKWSYMGEQGNPTHDEDFIRPTPPESRIGDIGLCFLSGFLRVWESWPTAQSISCLDLRQQTLSQPAFRCVY